MALSSKRTSPNAAKAAGAWIGLDLDQFSTVFPFHMTLHEDMTIWHAGPSVMKVCPGMALGNRFTDLFEIVSPKILPNLDALRNIGQARVTLEAKEPAGAKKPLSLRGQILPIGGRLVSFLGTPCISDPAEMDALGLTLGDFAEHDQAARYLALLQGKMQSLDNAGRLAKSLAAQRVELRDTHMELLSAHEKLERRVVERTWELSKANAALQEQVIEREEIENRILWQTYHDALTGLPNRIRFQERLEEALVSAREHGRGVAVLFLDIDRFKHINDTLGNDAGDILLKEVVEQLSSCLSPEDALARMGSDEFAIVLPHVATSSEVNRAAQKVLDILQNERSIEGHVIFISASVGISLFPDDGQDAQTLMRHADMAMYRAKEQCRGSVALYTEAMNISSFERLMLETSLRKALNAGELRLHYQPLVELGDGRIVAAEALVRWQHPDLGLVPPSKFIPIAEETGLIVPLGEWVLRTACAQATIWHEQGLRLQIGVNLSARQFEQPGLVEMVQSVLEQTGLAPEWLNLELTESTIVHNHEYASQTLRQLKDMGISISIDDFGTGYSSLSYLSRFPLDALKVDRSFITSLTENGKDQAVVKGMIDLAHDLDLAVVAEGVETAGQEESLRSLGCNMMQGYLFSPPVTSVELDELMARSIVEHGLRTAA